MYTLINKKNVKKFKVDEQDTAVHEFLDLERKGSESSLMFTEPDTNVVRLYRGIKHAKQLKQGLTEELYNFVKKHNHLNNPVEDFDLVVMRKLNLHDFTYALAVYEEFLCREKNRSKLWSKLRTMIPDSHISRVNHASTNIRNIIRIFTEGETSTTEEYMKEIRRITEYYSIYFSEYFSLQKKAGEVVGSSYQFFWLRPSHDDRRYIRDLLMIFELMERKRLNKKMLKKLKINKHSEDVMPREFDELLISGVIRKHIKASAPQGYIYTEELIQVLRAIYENDNIDIQAIKNTGYLIKDKNHCLQYFYHFLCWLIHDTYDGKSILDTGHKELSEKEKEQGKEYSLGYDFLNYKCMMAEDRYRDSLRARKAFAKAERIAGDERLISRQVMDSCLIRGKGIFTDKKRKSLKPMCALYWAQRWSFTKTLIKMNAEDIQESEDGSWGAGY